MEPGDYQPHFCYRPAERTDRKKARALQLTRWYQGVANRHAHDEALRSVEDALKALPEDPELLADFADLLLDAYKHGLFGGRRLVEKACIALEKARSDCSPLEHTCILSDVSAHGTD
jgi:hypothetical protein